MKILCIDIGNTSIHYGLVEGQTVTSVGHYPTDGLRGGASAQFLAKIQPSLEKASSISFCSVVPQINENLRATLPSQELPIFHLTHATCTGLDLVYPKPSEIGQDRIANAIAAQEYFGTPAIVIDMGSAVTFDIVSSKGYEGGIIAPGISLMRKHLHEQTALLPELSESDLVGFEGSIGKSTVHAMQIGVVVGFSGMVDSLLARVQLEMAAKGESNPVVLSTGGSIANLTKDWQRKTKFIEDLTLMGLAAAALR